MNNSDISFSKYALSDLGDVERFIKFNSAKNLDKNIIITRGAKGAIAINKGDIAECTAEKNLNIIDKYSYSLTLSVWIISTQIFL